jgi:hypothetical protein
MDILQPKKTKFREAIILDNLQFLDDKLFCEFGVARGASILDFYQLYKKYQLDTDFYGFDSFEGLPEETIDKYSPWRTGQFSTSGVVEEVLLNNKDIKIVKGWYSDTLNDDLLEAFGDKKIGIAHIDCDIYSSTIEVLEFLIQNDLLCDGSLLIYDDWGAYLSSNGAVDEYGVAEGRAHKEIMTKYNLNMSMVYREIIDPSFYVMSVFRYNKK